MIHGTSYQYDCSWFYLRKKHFCPSCKSLLVRKRREVVVNSESEEAQNYDFSCVDTYLHGNVKFITFYFQCPMCNAIYEIQELKSLEKRTKRKNRKNETC